MAAATAARLSLSLLSGDMGFQRNAPAMTKVMYFMFESMTLLYLHDGRMLRGEQVMNKVETKVRAQSSGALGCARP